MGTVNRTTLKGYFDDGDQPTGANFHSFVDSTLNVTESNNTRGDIIFNTSSAGMYYSGSSNDQYITTAASVDAATVTVSGRRFKIQNLLQAELPASGGIQHIAVTNPLVGPDSIVMANFHSGAGGTGLQATHANMGVMLSCSIHCYTTGSNGNGGVNGFRYYIKNESLAPIANNAAYTASFVVL